MNSDANIVNERLRTMQFNSFQFFIFFATVYFIYLLCNHRNQNRLLLVASYVFYAAWDYRFLSLIIFSTVVDYFTARAIHAAVSEKARKIFLIISVATNLGLLGFFKYFNFFAEGLADLLSWFGLGTHSLTLNIILPVGISFYTFQTMSHTIDIFRKKLTPSTSFLDFALYVSFFPQLVAGPIERAARFLPQICSARTMSLPLFKASTFLFLYGLFEKVVVADNLAIIVDNIYNNGRADGFSVLCATYGFALQIFADFDGYSNMAKGLAGLMGFTLVNNFNAPYFSETPSDFWQRWHISLSTWLRDYLYIPLGGNRHGVYKTVRNLLITMLLAGLWHGAGAMFVFWGGFHGLLLIAYLLFAQRLNSIPAVCRKLLLFHLVCFGWLLFRAQNFEQFTYLVSQLLFHFDFNLSAAQLLLAKKVLLYASVPLVYQYLQYRTENYYPIFEWNVLARSGCYTMLFYMIVIFGANNAQSFIYFQF